MIHPSERKYEDNKQIECSADCCAEQYAFEGGDVICVVVHLMSPPLLLMPSRSARLVSSM
jgi:hypothetical protein